jgi:prevent-host-death family protein
MKVCEQVSITNLRKNLSRYIRKETRGRPIIITVRGQSVALLISPDNHSATHIARELSRKGIGSWKGGKPKGASRPITVKGEPVSQIVIEERR